MLPFRWYISFLYLSSFQISLCMLFLETLHIAHGQILRLAYHQKRVEKTLLDTGGSMSAFSLCQLFADNPPPLTKERLRCRVLYDAAAVVQCMEYLPYQPRPLRSLRLVEAGKLVYDRKWADRSALDALFALRGSADDVLLVRDGRIMDTTIANVAFWDGRHWYTPAEPLLHGTHRSALLAEGVLHERHITLDDLSQYFYLRPLNALLRWGEVELPVSQIFR